MKQFRHLKNFSVLVGTPHADRKNYCFNEFVEMVKTFTYKNYNVVIADNSKSNKNYKLIVKHGLNSLRIKPKHKANQQYIAESHEAIRQYALKGGYDYLLHLESDVFPPPDIIERLLVHQKPLVSALYMIDFGHNSRPMVQHIESHGSIRETINSDVVQDFNLIDGTLKKVYSAGLGCMLIHKSILKKFTFRWEQGASMHPDSFFAGDIKQLNIPIHLDTSILCEHKNSFWIHQ
jgi:hypothetical protein